MAVPSTAVRAILAGNGSATAFPFGFVCNDAATIAVTYVDAAGNSTSLAPGSFSLTLNGNQSASPGGSVTYAPGGAPIASGTSLAIVRALPLTQTTAINNQDGFLPAVVTGALDTRAMVDQQLADAVGRALLLPPSDPLGATMSLPSSAARAGKWLGFDAFGNVVAGIPPLNLGPSFAGSLITQNNNAVTEALAVRVTESVSAGAGFYVGQSLIVLRNGGTGNREALHIEMQATQAAAGEFVVGFNAIGHIYAGSSGNVFGANGYAWVDSGALATAEACAAEFNTDVRRAIVRKVGVQVVDVATSIASGTSFDAGLIIGKQAGAVGYSAGISFGFDGAGGFGVFAGGALITAPPNTIALRAGLDFAGLGGVLTQACIVLPPNQEAIWFGGTHAGGRITSETATGGLDLLFANGQVAVRSGATLTHRFTTTDTYLIVNALGSKQLVAGAADSAGTGFRTLRVAN